MWYGTTIHQLRMYFKIMKRHIASRRFCTMPPTTMAEGVMNCDGKTVQIYFCAGRVGTTNLSHPLLAEHTHTSLAQTSAEPYQKAPPSAHQAFRLRPGKQSEYWYHGGGWAVACCDVQYLYSMSGAYCRFGSLSGANTRNPRISHNSFRAYLRYI